MNKNAGIKLLSGVVIGVVILLIVNSGGHSSKQEVTHDDANNLNEAIASQFNDNIRDVSARLIETEHKLKAIEKTNNELMTQNKVLASNQDSAGLVVKSDVSPAMMESIDALKRELKQLKETPAPGIALGTNYPVGSIDEKPKASSAASVKDIDALLIKHQLSEQERSYWNQFNKRRQLIAKKIKTRKEVRPDTEKDKGIPYYTIPAGADLGNTTLLSALIGEVPNDGKLMQPLFPFTAIISRGDLMASNGVPLPPDVSGMKVSGYAIGVGSFLDNISCVRAYVTSALFTFQDGHFVVVGQEQMKNTTELVNNESLGYLTTPYGNPCIHGKYFTNAPRVLASMMAAGGVGGVGNALSQWQMTYFAGPAGGAAIPTGSFGKYAAGGAVSEGAAKAADWLEKRIQGSFDMVFVPASLPVQRGNVRGFTPTRVSLHLTQTIAIDKQPQGRVLDYGRLQTYTHDFSLR